MFKRGLSVWESMDEAIKATSRLTDALIKKVLDFSHGEVDENGIVGAGLMARFVSFVGGKLSAKKQKEEEEKFRKIIRSLGAQSLEALERRLEQIDKQIDQLKNRWNELDRQVQDLESYVDDLENGKTPQMTEDVKKAIKEYEKKYSKKVDIYDLETMRLVLQFAQNNQTDVEREITKLELERADVTEEYVKQGGDPDLFIQNAKTRNDIVEKQGQEGVRDRAELQKDLKAEDNISEVDQEVYYFMVEFEKSKRIEDNHDRLVREQELVQGLSEEASMTLEDQGDTKHLFAENYFEPLKDREEPLQTAKLQESTPTNPFSPV